MNDTREKRRLNDFAMADQLLHFIISYSLILIENGRGKTRDAITTVTIGNHIRETRVAIPGERHRGTGRDLCDVKAHDWPNQKTSEEWE